MQTTSTTSQDLVRKLTRAAESCELRLSLLELNEAVRRKYSYNFATEAKEPQPTEDAPQAAKEKETPMKAEPLWPWDDPQRWAEESERLYKIREGLRIFQQKQEIYQHKIIAEEEIRRQEKERAEKRGRVLAQREQRIIEPGAAPMAGAVREQPRWREQCESFGAGFANALYDAVVVGPQELVLLGIGLLQRPHNEKGNNKYETQWSTETTTIDEHGGCGWVSERHGEEDQCRTTAGGFGSGRVAMEVNGSQKFGRGRQGTADRSAAFPSDKEASAATEGRRRWTFPVAHTEGRHYPQHMTFNAAD
ncbi:unnamed protein product [Vitrella brassicaformis CCMP3155]|uniref:Uncharacterized protein n=2 Tax=Vitrella brassicaformis TaxID=1169539 RepID=A0A0G4GGB4_VITBC|nr:unnamed protein product [Vitrella brassicaformis CCMP3155]|eukprot:CEM28660.1 unnamed protein product [Vitrella brassicaformis CCMP3155]